MKRWQVQFRGHPLAALVILAALSWFVLEIMVGIDFMADRWGAYEGTVTGIRTSWVDHVTLDFTPVKRLVITTDDGRTIEKMVTIENMASARIEVGDRVVKERGISHHAQVPGKPTVQEMIDAARP